MRCSMRQKHQLQSIYVGKQLNLYEIKPKESVSSLQKIEGIENLNNITREKKTIHTVGYRKNKLVSSTGQCHEGKKGSG